MSIIIDKIKSTGKLGKWPLIVTITATTSWVQEEDDSFAFEVDYKATGPGIYYPGHIKIPVSGNTEGKVDLMPGVSAIYEVSDCKVSEDHAHCHGKVTVKSPIGSCTLIDHDLDGDKCHVTIARYQAAIDEAMS